MELTESYRSMFPDTLAQRYRLLEVRNAAAILHALADDAFNELLHVLEGFQLTTGHLLNSRASLRPPLSTQGVAP